MDEYISNYFLKYINLKDSVKKLYKSKLLMINNLYGNKYISFTFLHDIKKILKILKQTYTNESTYKSYLDTLLFVYKHDPLFDKKLYEIVVDEKNKIKNKLEGVKLLLNINKEEKVGGAEKLTKEELKELLPYYEKLDLESETDLKKINKEYIDELSDYMILYFYLKIKPETKYDLFNFEILESKIPKTYAKKNFLYYSPMNQFMQLYYNNHKNIKDIGSIVITIDDSAYRMMRYYMKIYEKVYGEKLNYLLQKNKEPINNYQTYFTNLMKKKFNKKLTLTEVYNILNE